MGTELSVVLALAVAGLVLGSFSGALFWRVRAEQLKDDLKDKQKVSQLELKRLKKLFSNSITSGRSVCLECGKELSWYDLVPIFSWLFYRGKCRQCKKPIGYLEPILELSMAGFFVISYIFWPHALNDVLSISIFITWLMSGVLLAVLFVYDLKWFLLPDKINYTFMAVAGAGAILAVINSSDTTLALTDLFGAVMVLAGLYFILHFMSGGRLVGFGDVKLSLGLGFLLADWQLAIITLFLANLLGCLLVIPGLLSGKLKRTSRVPFGPFLIVGAVIAGLFGSFIIDFYLGITLI